MAAAACRLPLFECLLWLGYVVVFVCVIVVWCYDCLRGLGWLEIVVVLVLCLLVFVVFCDACWCLLIALCRFGFTWYLWWVASFGWVGFVGLLLICWCYCIHLVFMCLLLVVFCVWFSSDLCYSLVVVCCLVASVLLSDCGVCWVWMFVLCGIWLLVNSVVVVRSYSYFVDCFRLACFARVV